MKVSFYATLRPVVGGKTVDFTVPEGATAGDLLNVILGQYPALREKLLDEHGSLFGHVHFFVNGRDVQFLEKNFDTPLHTEDVITIFPAVGGGSR